VSHNPEARQARRFSATKHPGQPRRLWWGLLPGLLLLLLACGTRVSTLPDDDGKTILDDDDYNSPPSLPPDAVGTPEPTPAPTPRTYNLTLAVDWPQPYPLPDTRPLMVQVYPASALDASGHPLSNAQTYLTVRVPGPLTFPETVVLSLPPDETFGLVAWLDLSVDNQLNAGDVAGFSGRFIPTAQDMLYLSVALGPF